MMNGTRCDGIAQGLALAHSRRRLLGSFLVSGVGALGAAAVASVAFPGEAAAKKLCRKNGSRCKQKSKRCKARFCRATKPGSQSLTIQEPFTIEATWTSLRDHDTYFFVPNEAGVRLPSPFIDYSCNPNQTACETAYPFACVSQDAMGPGDEITTVNQLLAGTYEYWLALYFLAPDSDVTVRLRDADDQVVASWSSPENPTDQVRIGWHVFDIDGVTGTVTSIDRRNDPALPGPPEGVHDPNSDVCPW
jgi:hypothetical protein